MNEALGLGARLFIALQHVLPQHGLSRLVHRATRVEAVWFKNLLIRLFMKGFRPDVSDAVEPDVLAYPSFNAFFTRALRADARPLAADPRAIICPVDGTVSEAGPIDRDRLLQAKGRTYTLSALLAGQTDWADRFEGGLFATIYLAPYNYHRIHMALAGRLLETWFVPGKLFSVNRVTAIGVDAVFARNERVVCCFDDHGLHHAMVMVGALNVGSIETVWHGEIAPRSPRSFAKIPFPTGAGSPNLARGAELGRFNMGSTVILLLPRDSARWSPDFVSGRTVRMGEAIGERL